MGKDCTEEDIKADAFIVDLFRGATAEIVHKLLTGNDTQCFTSDQYRDEWLKLTRLSVKAVGIKRVEELWATYNIAAGHLKKVKGISEVSPGVWAAAERESR